MWKSIVVSFALATLATCAPSAPSAPSASSAPPKSCPTYYSLAQLARFDNIQNASPLVAVTPVNIYYDIFWQGMSVVEVPATVGQPGVVPNTKPNYAAYGQGDAATLDQGTPSMTINYSDSTIDHFDLKSFYYGCVTGLEQSATAVVISCKVTVTGKDKNGKIIKKQSFQFKSNGGTGIVGTTIGGLSQQMVKAELLGFTGLYSAEFSSTTGNAATDVVLATLIDTVSYIVWGASSISS